MTQERKNNLLPVGFYDLIFEDAEKNHEKINKALEYFMESGYRLVKPPLIEFLASAQDEQNAQSFSFTDKISGDELILRSDITLQIARLISRISKSEKLPLKICYVGDAIIKESGELYADRQSTQLGIEIVGDYQDSNFEIVAMILQILPQIIDKEISIEFSIPEFAEIFCDALNLKSLDLIEAIKSKNLSKIEEIAKNDCDLIKDIALNNESLRNLSNDILDVTNDKRIAQKLQEMAMMEEFLSANFKNVQVNFDLFGDNRSSYHKDLYFDVFCEGFSYPIARGGRYDLQGVNSVGATIYMNYLRKI